MAADVRIFQEVPLGQGQPWSLHVPQGHSVHTFSISGPARPLAGSDPTWPSWVEQLAVVVTTRFPVVDARRIVLPRMGEDGRDRALALQLQVPGGLAWVVAVHLSRRCFPYGPVRQAAHLARQLPPGPVVVAGDHNFWRTPLRAVMARGQLTPLGGGATWPAARPHAGIDHVWARQVRGVARVGGSAGSDHLPVEAVLRLDR